MLTRYIPFPSSLPSPSSSSGDSTGSSVAAQKTKYTNLANSRPSTILSLQHEVHRSSVYEVLPHAISVLKAKGYRFVTLADCLGRNKYQRTGAPEARNVSNFKLWVWSLVGADAFDVCRPTGSVNLI